MFLLLCLLALEVGSRVAYGADWDRFNWEAARLPGNTVVRAMAVFAGKLYVGTEFPGGTAQVWRFSGGAWINVSPAWLGSNTAVGAMMVYENLLFVGTENASAGAQLWRMTAAEAWTQEAPGWSVPANWSVASMALYDNCLYVGLTNAGGCQLWRRNAGGAWSQVAIAGSFGSTNNTSIPAMCAMWGWLYAGTRNAVNGAQLWRISAGTTPSLINHTGPWSVTTDAVSSLCASLGYLYVGTERPALDGGAQIWRTDGTSWLNVVNSGFGNVDNDRISALHVAGACMYAGTRNLAGGESACLYATGNGLNWWLEDDEPGLDNPLNNDIRCFATFDGNVYLGTSNPQGSEIYRTDLVTVAWGGGGGGGGGGGICHVTSSMTVSDKKPALPTLATVYALLLGMAILIVCRRLPAPVSEVSVQLSDVSRRLSALSRLRAMPRLGSVAGLMRSFAQAHRPFSLRGGMGRFGF